MKTKTFTAIILILISISISHSSSAQNIKFYNSNPSVPVSAIDFNKDSILYIAIKADTALMGYDMMLFNTMLSHKNGKRKWEKSNNLMGESFYGKLRDDGYYHFVAFRILGGGLSFSEIGLSESDLRFGKLQMNTSLYGKKRINSLDIKDSDVNTDVHLISSNNGYIQYEADIIDFSLPVTIERFNESANIRKKKNIVIAAASVGLLCLIFTPLLILLPIL